MVKPRMQARPGGSEARMAAGCLGCGELLPGYVPGSGDEAGCSACGVMTGGSGPAAGGGQFATAAWPWGDPAAAQALRSRRLGLILRAYRKAHALTQEQLAGRLGYDKTYVSMMETGRRPVHDVPARRHIAQVLAIPPHLLGVTDARDTEHAALVAFAESAVRMADLARAGGQAARAVGELWPVVARLESCAAAGQLEADTLAVLGRAWVSLGTCLGTVLPEERLGVAVGWTGRGVAAAEQIGEPGALSQALAMHGNELRKSGRTVAAVAVLGRAVAAARCDGDRGAALALLARAAGSAGDSVRFAQAADGCRDLIDRHGPAGPLMDLFAWREIQLRGLLELGDHRRAVALAGTATNAAAPGPQWEIIERVTFAHVLMTAGDHAEAEAVLLAAVDGASRYRLPHQVQRVIRIAGVSRRSDLLSHAKAALLTACADGISAPIPA